MAQKDKGGFTEADKRQPRQPCTVRVPHHAPSLLLFCAVVPEGPGLPNRPSVTLAALQCPVQIDIGHGLFIV